jgi:hypothetical protein
MLEGKKEQKGIPTQPELPEPDEMIQTKYPGRQLSGLERLEAARQAKRETAELYGRKPKTSSS